MSDNIVSDKKTAYLTRLYFELLHKIERAISAIDKQKNNININDYCIAFIIAMTLDDIVTTNLKYY